MAIDDFSDPTNPYKAPLSDIGPEKGAVGEYVGYAGFWTRFLAAVIDNILLSCISFPIGMGVGLVGAAMSQGGAAGGPPDAALLGIQIVAQVLGLAINLAYFTLMESSSYQASLGKMALGLKVTDLYGQRISPGRALGRTAGKFVSSLICLIGYIMAAFTERKQALHDMMASTLVLRTR